MSQSEKHYTNVKTERYDSKSEMTISVEIPAENISHYRSHALKKLGAEVKIDGFRKGHVPEDVLVKHVGEAEILREAASHAIEAQYPLVMQEVLEKESLPIIGQPSVSVTKLAPDNPIGFSIQLALMPEVKLPDYKKIAKQHNSKTEDIEVKEEEVQETIVHLRRERAKIERIEKGMGPQQAGDEVQNLPTLELPGLDDAFAKTLGFENAEKFTEKLRENIKHEKEHRAREKNRIAIIEDIIKSANIPLPNVLVEHELNAMEEQFAQDLSQGGTTIEKYLEHTKKTREDLRNELREGAEKRTRMHLVLRAIAEAEKIEAPKEDVEKQVKHTLEHHKDANEEHVRSYFTLNLRNESVFRFLEERK